MQIALRPYATAGVALVGASVIAVSPVTVTQTAAQEVRDAAVQLSALTNPIEAFRPVFEAAVADLQALGQQIGANPAPILQAILANLPGNIADLPGNALAQLLEIPQIPGQLPGQIGAGLAGVLTLAGLGQTFLQNVLTALTSTDPNVGGVPVQLQAISTAIQNGDFGTALGDLSVLPILPLLGPGLQNATLFPELAAVFQQQLANLQELLPIASGPLETAQKAIGVFVNDPTALLLVGIGPLLAINGAATAVGNGISQVIQSIQNGDPEGALNAVITQAANAATSIVSGVLDPNFGLLGGLQHLREEIGTAIGAPLAIADAAKALPGATAKSVTLTAPLEKAPASNPGTTSGEAASGSGAVSATDPGTTTKAGGETTPTDNKGDVKGGNLFTPGGSGTKGGRHRAADGPSFGQELKDAASKTFKGLTGLGGGSKSEGSSTGASASESGSGSSSSSGSSSGSK